MKNFSTFRALRFSALALLCLCLCCSLSTWAQGPTAPFQRGVNLTGWFQAAGARQIQFSKYSKKDFEQIKQLGCDVIRLPINLHHMTSGAPNYTLDPLFLSFLDQAVGWARELDLHLILDNHTFDPAVNTETSVGPILEKVWPQMAQHYKNNPAKLYYEILNEPHGIDDASWSSIQQKAINAIRRHDTQHTIIVGAANWNSFHNLQNLPRYTDPNLIYTFHFYDPFLFTHQGASWTDPSLISLAGMPFPYEASRMPGLPASLKGSWIEGAYQQYAQEGTVARVKEMIDIAARFQQERQVPVYCGEFGVYLPNSPTQDRISWHQTVREYLEQKGIAWTSWDYHGGFGIFETEQGGQFEHDLNIPLLQALGLETPDQTEWVMQPESTGFALYTDHVGPQLSEASWGSGQWNYYASEKPNNGQFALSWSGASRYDALAFDFTPDKDFSQLLQEGYALDFMFRGSEPGLAFDIRFIDTKSPAPDDLPWRASVSLDQNKVTFDSRWHHVHIPLSAFVEQGSWYNNTWHNPEGKFSWAAIDRLEIVAEHSPMGNSTLWFDNLYITNADTARVLDTGVYPGEVTGLNPLPVNAAVVAYPNPMHNYLQLESSSSEPAELLLLDATGRQWKQATFRGNIKLNIEALPAGLYLLKLSTRQGWHSTQRFVKR